jgi:hypothetical protein
MCNGCKHEAACAALKVIDLTEPVGPCFEPAGFTSKLDAMRQDLTGLPQMLQLARKPEPAHTTH